MFPDDVVVHVESGGPGLITESLGAFGRSDDVGKQHGRKHAVRRRGRACTGNERFNLVKHPVGIAGKPHIVVPVELHQTHLRDAIGEIAGVAVGHVAITAAV
jgi:hypothetical protein